MPKPSEELEQCPICGLMKPYVEERRDHYAEEIGNAVGATMICCADCEHDNLMDI